MDYKHSLAINNKVQGNETIDIKVVSKIFELRYH